MPTEGFAGAQKVFLIQFAMPIDGNRGFNGDMPSLWFLNDKIPRTQQYGACSCWIGCGEFDAFEVLAPGETRCKSTIHSDTPGGASDWFTRPQTPIVAAVIFDGPSGSIAVKVLEGMDNFPASLTTEQVQGWLAVPAKSDPMSSQFVVT